MPSHAEAKKMKLARLHTSGCFRTSLACTEKPKQPVVKMSRGAGPHSIGKKRN